MTRWKRYFEQKFSREFLLKVPFRVCKKDVISIRCCFSVLYKKPPKFAKFGPRRVLFQKIACIWAENCQFLQQILRAPTSRGHDRLISHRDTYIKRYNIIITIHIILRSLFKVSSSKRPRGINCYRVSLFSRFSCCDASLRHEGCFFSGADLPKLASKQDGTGEETKGASLASQQGFYLFLSKWLCGSA